MYLSTMKSYARKSDSHYANYYLSIASESGIALEQSGVADRVALATRGREQVRSRFQIRLPATQ